MRTQSKIPFEYPYYPMHALMLKKTLGLLMQLHKQHQKSLTTLQDANKKDSKGKKSNGHIIKYLSIEKGQAGQGKYLALGHDAYSYAWSECHALEPNILSSPLTKSLTTNNSTTRLKTLILSSYLFCQSLKV